MKSSLTSFYPNNLKVTRGHEKKGGDIYFFQTTRKAPINVSNAPATRMMFTGIFS